LYPIARPPTPPRTVRSTPRQKVGANVKVDPQGAKDPTLSVRTTSRRCGVRIRGGRYCKNPAGFNTDHPGLGQCSRHGGNAKHQLTSLGRTLAHQGIMNPDIAPNGVVEIDPLNALSWAVYLAAGDLAFWQSLVGAAYEAVLKSGGDKDDMDAFLKVQDQSRRARMDMTRISKISLDAGVAERQVAMQEKMAAIIANTIQAVVNELPLTPEQQALVPELVRSKLLTLEAPGGTRYVPKPEQSLRNYKKVQVYAEPDAA
jgi:hypothetical protein